MTTTKYKCLRCNRNISFEEVFFPFCSSACKKSDLYGWMNEEYAIIETNQTDDDPSPDES